MFKKKITEQVLEAIEKSPGGIASLDILLSLRICNSSTLKTTISRLNKTGRLIRLKRGTYSASPMRNAFLCAQSTFNGYLGFSSALYLHGIITELPFTISVVTAGNSGKKQIGEYQFKAISLKEKGVGFEKNGEYTVSSRAKTLFDCLYLPEYSIERQKLIEAYKDAGLSKKEWAEFDLYVEKFAGSKMAKMEKAKKEIRGN
ncbi:hypothetical protein HY989_07075 [Candidatus Micrarchaeota archaeon]|nr:hypothetical protein [Candidatus Micrarchaeota archaeon]